VSGSVIHDNGLSLNLPELVTIYIKVFERVIRKVHKMRQ